MFVQQWAKAAPFKNRPQLLLFSSYHMLCVNTVIDLLITKHNKCFSYVNTIFKYFLLPWVLLERNWYQVESAAQLPITEATALPSESLEKMGPLDTMLSSNPASRSTVKALAHFFLSGEEKFMIEKCLV